MIEGWAVTLVVAWCGEFPTHTSLKENELAREQE
jgi:hypothetical protein